MSVEDHMADPEAGARLRLVDALQSLPPSLFKGRLQRAYKLVESDDRHALQRIDELRATDDPDRLEELIGRTWPEPEDRGSATLSPLGGVEYVEDLIRPGRIVVVAAEEGTGKSYAITGELGIRLAVAGGSFAGTWPILRTGPVLVLSEMHADDDYSREEAILAALELTRESLAGCYYRLALASAAGDSPALQVPEWREWITGWLRERGALLAVFDTATAAAQVDPWGGDIQAVYRGLRMMLEQYPDLAIILIVHLRKPQGHGERRISDVLGEWGRWCDVLLLLEADGLERVKLTVRKRVRRERRITAVKRDGLLVDPQDIGSAGPRVPLELVVAAIRTEPGIDAATLAERTGVTKRTALTYSEAAETAGLIRREKSGKRGAIRCYPAQSDPDAARNRETPGNEHAFTVLSESEPVVEAGTVKAGNRVYKNAVPLSQSQTPAVEPFDGSEEELLAAAEAVKLADRAELP